jgi:hypothetical protein
MNENIPEAPASVTYSITTAKGYSALFTLRDMTGTGLLEKMDQVEEVFEKKGYKPQVRGFAKKEVTFVEGKKCPKDGGRLIEKISTKTGKKFLKCENGRWNPQTGPSGCDYIDWLEPKIEFNHNEPYSDGNQIPVEEYDKGY